MTGFPDIFACVSCDKALFLDEDERTLGSHTCPFCSGRKLGYGNDLKSKFPDIYEPKKDDICYATTNRQAAVKKIAKNCEMFFVIGSRNSSNSVRLLEVAKNNGCLNSELIHTESKVPIDKIANCKTIGISSGASAPEVLVEEFINKLKKEFTVEIEEVEIVKEDITFKIPGKLN